MRVCWDEGTNCARGCIRTLIEYEYNNNNKYSKRTNKTKVSDLREKQEKYTNSDKISDDDDNDDDNDEKDNMRTEKQVNGEDDDDDDDEKG